MSLFKKNADLRTTALKNLLNLMEQERDSLLDAVAEKKGRVAQLEDLIRKSYEMILDINKEEQQKEINALIESDKKRLENEEVEKKRKELETFENAKRGIKTPKPNKRTRSK